MKKILISISTVAFLGVLVLGATSAFFSDTAVSEGNTFTAGEVDLTINDINYTGTQPPTFNEDGLSFSLDDLKPLDSGKITYQLENGSNEAHVCVLVENVTDEPEPNDSALADMLTFMYGSDSGQISSVAGVWQSLGQMTSEQIKDFSVDYCFGEYDENDNCVLDDIDYNPAQLGQMVADLKFYAVQTRHNEEFDCDSLNPQPPVIDGVITADEWDNAIVMQVADNMGEVRAKKMGGYLYVLIDVQDGTDARSGQNLVGNDQIGFNINPTNGAAWGHPYDIIFQTGADENAWGGTSSGQTDDWKTQWSLENVQQGSLPTDLETMTLYSGGQRVSEWKIPLGSVTPTLVGGAIDVGDGNSYVYPIGLDWNDASTFQAL